MIDLLILTNDPTLAAQCDALPGMRLFVDLEHNGKAERQAGRNTFISSHHISDVGRIKAVLKHAPLMVRVNPYQQAQPHISRAEIDAVLSQGADMLMLPMFTSAAELRAFAAAVGGRVPITALLETAGAMASMLDWVGTPGLSEVFVGLNDLHLSLNMRFMFEPLARGLVDQVALAAQAHGLRFGFGGMARMDEGSLPGRDVLAEHVRLGSGAVILSRGFRQTEGLECLLQAIAALRRVESELSLRTPQQQAQDQLRVRELIDQLAAKTPSSTASSAASAAAKTVPAP